MVLFFWEMRASTSLACNEGPLITCRINSKVVLKTENESKETQSGKGPLGITWCTTKFHKLPLGRKKKKHIGLIKDWINILGPKVGNSLWSAARLQRSVLIAVAHKYDFCYAASEKHGFTDGLSPLFQLPRETYTKSA